MGGEVGGDGAAGRVVGDGGWVGLVAGARVKGFRKSRDGGGGYEVGARRGTEVAVGWGWCPWTDTSKETMICCYWLFTSSGLLVLCLLFIWIFILMLCVLVVA